MRSKLITTSTVINDEAIEILGYQIQPDGSNAATLVLYNEGDNSATAAKRVAASRVAATASGGEWFDKPLYCDQGCYAALTGTNAIAFIYIK